MTIRGARGVPRRAAWMVLVGIYACIVLATVLAVPAAAQPEEVPEPSPPPPTPPTPPTHRAPPAHRRRMCRGTEHLDGSWTLRADAENPQAKKSFFCCSWDNDDFLSDEEMCGTEHPDKLFYQGSDEHYTQMGGHGCVCDSINGRYTVSPREKYVWTPRECNLPGWHAKNFCSTLGNRTIMMIGDSTMQQSASTVMSMIKAGDGGCAHQLTLARSDYLQYNIPGKDTDIVTHVLKYAPDIVIINGGAWYRDDGDIWSFWWWFEKALPQIRKHFQDTKNITFAWKTQNPGHVSCEDYDHPWSEPKVMDRRSDRYHWLLHPYYDEVSRNFSHSLGLKVIDMSPLYLRPDGHPYDYAHKKGSPDCLHYCLPGPLDLFSVLLYQMLWNKDL